MEQATWISRDDAAAADRFLAAVESALRILAAMPAAGRPCGFERAELSGIRQWPIPRLGTHLLFYVHHPRQRVVKVVRVLHGARDTRRFLEAEAET